MKWRRIAMALAAGLGLGLGASAQTVKIGVIAALTGGGAPLGIAAAQGAKIAAAEINARGGLEVGGRKHKVEVIAYDDQYKAADAVAAYNRLVRQDGAKYVIIMGSAAALALKQNVEDDKVIALTSSYSSQVIDKDTRYMFRLFSIASDYLPALVTWTRDNYRERRIFTLNPNDETGWDQSKLSASLLKQNGFTLAGQEVYERTLKDFQPLFTKIIALKPEMIDLGSTSPATAGLMIRQARELGYKGLFVKTGGAGPRDIVAGAGKEAAENMVSVLYADPKNAGYQRLAAAYRKSIGQEPNEIVVSFYDAVNVLFAAMEKAGTSSDTGKVAAAFGQALPMNSVQGDRMTLGGTQSIMTTMYIGVMKNGEPVVVGKAR